ncbi:DUF2303 family protein [Ancylobacter sp. WKF20]|uniref:DUF2303 family protein n=1 Tax=Ancylobacter sp. WKF20 TaxID=3039801 RepID=UPI0024344D2F|nr:DUF2303 family protein [Ancylobacter sp. WKF20]WGD31242.1 DUF2303 family protein [Ancylobacter sp. WKF20]
MSAAVTKNDLPTPSAVSLIAEMAARAAGAQPVTINTEGLGPGLPPNVPGFWDPAQQRLVSVHDEIERYRQAPKAIRGTAKVETLESVTELVNRHKTANSAIFAATGWPNPKLTAVIDYHAVDHAPDFQKHRVEYGFPLTEEFKAWVGGNGKSMEQQAFAEFLEEHAAELAAPFDSERTEYEPLFKERFALPNELIELSHSLEVFVGAKMKSAVRLQSGERQMVFETEHMNGKGEPIDIPGIFMIQLPPFVDGDVVRIPARIRYRAGQGAVTWFYQLYRWEYWLRTRVQNDLLEAGKGTGLPTFEGAPES